VDGDGRGAAGGGDADGGGVRDRAASAVRDVLCSFAAGRCGTRSRTCNRPGTPAARAIEVCKGVGTRCTSSFHGRESRPRPRPVPTRTSDGEHARSGVGSDSLDSNPARRYGRHPRMLGCGLAVSEVIPGVAEGRGWGALPHRLGERTSPVHRLRGNEAMPGSIVRALGRDSLQSNSARPSGRSDQTRSQVRGLGPSASPIPAGIRLQSPRGERK
jgi:hypothetical protein